MKTLSDSELGQVSGGSFRGACFRYTIRKGDSLIKLAQCYHTTIDVLRELNPEIAYKDILIEGYTILIPYNCS